MIYTYEAQILKYLNKLFPDIKLATYSKEQNMFNAMSSVTKFPSFYYSRSSDSWTFNKGFEVTDSGIYDEFIPIEQIYVGRIILENQSQALDYARRLRFKWNKEPFVTLGCGCSEEKLKVSLRLLYIKVDEDRLANDKKGALRYVEFSWKSTLFVSLSSFDDCSLFEGNPVTSVKEVHLLLDDQANIVRVFNEKDLIKEINE